MTKKAVLLINLGTPDACSPRAVRRYLREFLLDPRVIDLPAMLRWPFVNFVIVPFRYKKTTAAYQKIWREHGSPQLFISQGLKTALAQTLGEDYQVELGMRYGRPSLIEACQRLATYQAITVVPLFPQYASAASGSAIAQVLQFFKQQWNVPTLNIIHHFYPHPGFINAAAQLIKQHTQDKKIDLILFSYHGLPERHVNKSGCHTACDRLGTCSPIDSNNHFCYRAQCFTTTDRIATQLGLAKHQYQTAFQSRLGRTPWIKPYTDLILPDLIKRNIKNIAVVSPSFVTDCLETLEEIDIRTRQQWSALGGETFTFVPCVNHSALWVQALAQIVLC